MDEEDFEGTLVLEKLAEIGKVEAFFAAVDSDDFGTAQRLMRNAGIDAQTIQVAIKKMRETEGADG